MKFIPNIQVSRVDEIKTALERDNFMTADAAKEFGLIDQVVDKKNHNLQYVELNLIQNLIV